MSTRSVGWVVSPIAICKAGAKATFALFATSSSTVRYLAGHGFAVGECAILTPIQALLQSQVRHRAARAPIQLASSPIGHYEDVSISDVIGGGVFRARVGGSSMIQTPVLPFRLCSLHQRRG